MSAKGVWRTRLLAILREPLLHFALAGGALFAVHAALKGDEEPRTCAAADEPARVITLREADLDSMRAGFRRSWKRDPDPEQLGDLVHDSIVDEILYREGRARDLDLEDAFVRQRVIEKMRALVRPTETPEGPTRERLERWFNTYPHRFVQAPRITFEQIYFDPKRRARLGQDAAAAARAVLQSAAPGEAKGDDFVLSRLWQDSPEPQAVNAFGAAFARRLMAAPLGAWEGPVESEYGVHLVRVTSRRPARMPSFTEAEAYVRADFAMVQSRGVDEVQRSYLPRYRVALEGSELQRLARTAALRGLLAEANR